MILDVQVIDRCLPLCRVGLRARRVPGRDSANCQPVLISFLPAAPLTEPGRRPPRLHTANRPAKQLITSSSGPPADRGSGVGQPRRLGLGLLTPPNSSSCPRCLMEARSRTASTTHAGPSPGPWSSSNAASRSPTRCAECQVCCIASATASRFPPASRSNAIQKRSPPGIAGGGPAVRS